MRHAICFFAFTVAMYSGSLAYAQHGHGAGGPMGVGAMHGDADAHGHSETSEAGASSSHAMMASTNPGDVLDHNTHLSSK